jgi:alkylation response protein AidB-like acyl-CoA dehydrogenase
MTFEAPVADILFSLRHVAGAGLLADWDDDLAESVLSHFGDFAAGVIAPLNAVGDRQGAQLENGRVRMPDGFAAAYADLAAGGWQGLTLPEAHGGMAASPLIAAGVSEIFSGANHAMQMVCNLVPGAAAVLLRDGTAAQQADWLPKLASGEALSTMCLTEPAAGSDLSAIRCKAVRAESAWQITGEKIFISGGDQDMSDTILHLVLARSGSAGLGGLSLFLCPKQPAVTITRIEDKMGLHASPTCQMAFDAAKAELIGAEGEGLGVMFTLMNHARIDVALQGVAHAARAALIARRYAMDRVQGRLPDKSPARLHLHADVARMLDRQDRLAIGARAMCHITLLELERGARPALVDFLTPLCKIAGSQAGVESADLGIQILGGYGYLREYGLEQIWRDARICSIYEGANGIHERTTATRALRPGGGSADFADLIGELAGGDAALMTRLADWQDHADRLRNADDALPRSHAFAQDTVALFFDAVWTRIAAVADKHPQPERIERLAQA